MISIHRFRNNVAISIGESSTYYITDKEAKILVRELKKVRKDLKKHEFSKSEYEQTVIPMSEWKR